MGVLSVVAGSTFAQLSDTPTDTKQTQDIEGERRRIQNERARLESLYEKEEALCYARFAVTDCLGQVRVRRRETLSVLRRQEVALNTAERMKNASIQLNRIRERSAVQPVEGPAIESREIQQER